MNLLLLSLLIIQNVTSYFENFKNGVNTQFVKDKVKYGPGNEVHNLNSLSGGCPRGSTGTPGSYFKSQHPKIDVNKLDSLLNTSNYLKPLQYILKSSESMKMFANSASQLSPYRLSRKLNDDSSNYDDGKDDESFLETNGSDKASDKDDDGEDKDQFDDENEDSFLETNGSDKASDKDDDGEDKDQFDDENEDSFLETNGSDKMSDKDDDGEDKDQFDDENEDSFLEKDEYDEISDNDHDMDNDDFSEDHEESFLEKEEYDDVSDNDNDEFYDEDAESFLEQEEYEDLSDNENDEFDEAHGESFLEKEDGDDDSNDDSNEDNGKEYKEEYQNKMTDDDYPDEYVGSDDLKNSTKESTQSGNENGSKKDGGNENGNKKDGENGNGSKKDGGNDNGSKKDESNAKELKNKGKESFLEQNVNGHTEEENEKHSTFVSSYLDNDDTEDKHNDEIYNEGSFLEEGSYSHNDDGESDDTFDEYYEDSFLERGKLGTPYSDYYEEDADEEDTKEANEDTFDNHYLNEISSTNDVHSFIQKDMGFIDELIDDNETIKEAVKKGSKKAMKQSMHKLNLLDDEDFEDKESLSDDEINGFMEENMDASKLDAKKAKTTLRNPEKNKNASSAEGKGSGSNGNAGSSITATNATNATTKSKSETNKKQTDLSNEDLFNDELTEEVIADSYEEGGNLGTEEGENFTNAFDDKLLDQGVNENTLLNDNNMIFNAKMVPHKKRELYISPHKHTSATNNKSGKHQAVDVDALDKKLRAHQLLELENGEGNNSVIVETEEVDVDLNGGKSSSSVSFLSSVVFLLIGLLCFTN
ncbi:rhoptry associated membrane antigen [Plasmodium cynomolgi strain B]|uniref:Rhoptry associated membrane antigen n=1 Tax=Plasmodium cynomolgi (strain B) TaxID=1120755 RepID=K6URD6_PLACD|nr:rhoptry associated membrane antigen [Plasmodium cynomolgi strain B]GAB64410.1 rhoptry associated membrane antigen [Plasmodium cynomolgi strain B]